MRIMPLNLPWNRFNRRCSESGYESGMVEELLGPLSLWLEDDWPQVALDLLQIVVRNSSA